MLTEGAQGTRRQRERDTQRESFGTKLFVPVVLVEGKENTGLDLP